MAFVWLRSLNPSTVSLHLDLPCGQIFKLSHYTIAIKALNLLALQSFVVLFNSEPTPLDVPLPC